MKKLPLVVRLLFAPIKAAVLVCFILPIAVLLFLANEIDKADALIEWFDR